MHWLLYAPELRMSNTVKELRLDVKMPEQQAGSVHPSETLDSKWPCQKTHCPQKQPSPVSLLLFCELVVVGPMMRCGLLT